MELSKDEFFFFGNANPSNSLIYVSNKKRIVTIPYLTFTYKYLAKKKAKLLEELGRCFWKESTY
jgi:hypothetical protein